MQRWHTHDNSASDNTIKNGSISSLREALEKIASTRSRQEKEDLSVCEVLDMLVLILFVLKADLYQHNRREHVTELRAEVVVAGEEVPLLVRSKPSATYSEEELLLLTLALKAHSETCRDTQDQLPQLPEFLDLFASMLNSPTILLQRGDRRSFEVKSVSPIIYRKSRMRFWLENFQPLVQRAKQVLFRTLHMPLFPKQRSQRKVQFKSNLSSNIETYGFSVVGVFDPSGDTPMWAYTIGLHHTNQRLPEIIVIGLSQAQLRFALKTMAEKMLQGGIFEAGCTYVDLVQDEYPCFLGEVDLSHYEGYVGQAIDYYGGCSFPLLQLVWSSQKLFPWEPGFKEEFRSQQPLLFDPRKYHVL